MLIIHIRMKLEEILNVTKSNPIILVEEESYYLAKEGRELATDY